MKDFFKWFKSGAKIKRWLFLMLVGIVMVGYGVSEVIVTDKISSIGEIAKIVCTFVFGFTFTVVGIIHMQKRTLEMLVEETAERNTQNNVKSLIFNKKVYNQGPKVVVIGGGAGLNTVLKGLKRYTDNITAIVTVSDYGNKSKGILDDITGSFVALSNDEEKLDKIMNLEMQNGQGNVLKFRDIYFNAMQEVAGDFYNSIEKSSDILNMVGKVIPVTLDEVKICAELEDGTVVESKDRIPEVVNEKVSKINRIYLSPTNCRVAPGVLEAIKEADAIVIGPGSLYTNVIPNLLVAGVSKEIKESKAFKIYVSNIMTEFGQTDCYSLSEHIKAIIEHAGKGIIDYCIYDTGEIVPEYIRKYNKEGCDLVEQDTSNVKGMGIKLIQRNLSLSENGIVRHNPDAIATAIVQLICDDLKFNDMQNDAQFMLLDSKIKDTKKRLKESNRKKKDKSKKDLGRKGKNSKFFEKYNTRIESIKESERKPKKNKSGIISKIEKEKAMEDNKPFIEKTIKEPEVTEVVKKVKEKSEKESKITKAASKGRTPRKNINTTKHEESKSSSETKANENKKISAREDDLIDIINRMRR